MSGYIREKGIILISLDSPRKNVKRNIPCTLQIYFIVLAKEILH